MAKTVSTKKISSAVSDSKKDSKEPIINEKNEILFDGEKELEKVLEKIADVDVNLEISDSAKEGLNALKNMEDINNLPTDDDINKTIEHVNTQLRDLDTIEAKLKSDIENKMAEIKNKQVDFTSFWSGISDGWN